MTSRRRTARRSTRKRRTRRRTDSKRKRTRRRASSTRRTARRSTRKRRTRRRTDSGSKLTRGRYAAKKGPKPILYNALRRQARREGLIPRTMEDVYKGLNVPFAGALESEIERIESTGHSRRDAERMARVNLSKWGIRRIR